MYIVHMQTLIQGMLDDYVPGKVENSNKLEVSDVSQFNAFKYLKYQISKEESDRSERYSNRQQPKHSCLGFTSQQLTKFTTVKCGRYSDTEQKSNIDSPT